ncbi:hypothetical protein MOV98_11975 [Acinetobacter variabilis]|nr:hypothetical protein MOV98_11975 [Acinetobacter variabilis]
MIMTELGQLNLEYLNQLQIQIEQLKQQQQMHLSIEDSLKKTVEIQKHYQIALEEKIVLLETELKHNKLTLNNYEQELKKELPLPDLSTFLADLKPALLQHLKAYLNHPEIIELIKQLVEINLNPHLQNLKALDSVDWSALQNSEVPDVASLEVILKDLDGMRMTLKELMQTYKIRVV